MLAHARAGRHQQTPCPRSSDAAARRAIVSDPNVALLSSATSTRAGTERATTASPLAPAPVSLCLCHGLSCLDAAAGRLLQPGDAQAEPLEAGGARRAVASMGHRPTTSARSDRPASTVRVIGMRGTRSCRGRDPDESFRSGTSRPRSCALATFRVLPGATSTSARATALRQEGPCCPRLRRCRDCPRAVARDGSVDVAGMTASDPQGTMHRRSEGPFRDAVSNAGGRGWRRRRSRMARDRRPVPKVPCNGRRPLPHQRLPVIWRPSRTDRECPDIELCG